MTLDIITDDLLDGVTHGFFGRKGGASSGVFAGLNCGFGSSDQHDIVAINRSRVAEAMGGTAGDMVGVHQWHSADVISVTAPSADKPKADAMQRRPRFLTVWALPSKISPRCVSCATRSMARISPNRSTCWLIPMIRVISSAWSNAPKDEHISKVCHAWRALYLCFCK